jgi:hypothetical protein
VSFNTGREFHGNISKHGRRNAREDSTADQHAEAVYKIVDVVGVSEKSWAVLPNEHNATIDPLRNMGRVLDISVRYLPILGSENPRYGCARADGGASVPLLAAQSVAAFKLFDGNGLGR